MFLNLKVICKFFLKLVQHTTKSYQSNKSYFWFVELSHCIFLRFTNPTMYKKKGLILGGTTEYKSITAEKNKF